MCVQLMLRSVGYVDRMPKSLLNAFIQPSASLVAL